ncbi:laminin-like protein epi-1 [Dreissena polymorpha]|uniref:Uncharacterized protein n=1 Tax=Dreissena polymorpha TaxID=45954 RepID=A0A9D4GTP5_DREPO|nr:laminin-like protein epi-1 [Dreissena polymorpha]KAH3822803.1 hypothetical protein DPMN_124594 [Dreissena polymorpha]
MRLLIVNCILLALVCQCATKPCVEENKPCSKETESEETSSGCKSSSDDTDSDDPKYKIVIQIKEEGSSSSKSSCQDTETPCDDGCPDCSETEHAQCNKTTKQCECKFDGEFPSCCPNCSAGVGQICCKPGMNCESANVRECFCQFGEIPKDGPVQCCPNQCDGGNVCAADGTCQPPLPFGAKCVEDGVRSSNACDRKAGIKCHTYDCCGKAGNGIECRDKYCLCETPRGWKYNNETVPCVFEGGRPDKKLCLDAPVGFGAPSS